MKPVTLYWESAFKYGETKDVEDEPAIWKNKQIKNNYRWLSK